MNEQNDERKETLRGHNSEARARRARRGLFGRLATLLAAAMLTGCVQGEMPEDQIVMGEEEAVAQAEQKSTIAMQREKARRMCTTEDRGARLFVYGHCKAPAKPAVCVVNDFLSTTFYIPCE